MDHDPKKVISFADICNAIADHILLRTGERPDPQKDIFEASAKGELWHVFELHDMAVADGMTPVYKYDDGHFLV